MRRWVPLVGFVRGRVWKVWKEWVVMVVMVVIVVMVVSLFVTVRRLGAC
jgi:hypothetical protein